MSKKKFVINAMPVLLWIECLPDGIKEKAFYNAFQYGLNDEHHNLTMDVSTLASAISSAFVWRYTSEGYGYWANLASEFKE